MILRHKRSVVAVCEVGWSDRILQDAIKALIMARFDKFTAKGAAHTNGHTTNTNGEVSRSTTPKQESKPPVSKKRPPEESEDLSDVRDSPAPKKKKKIDHDSDAAFAAKLQAQENARMRATRGGGPKKTGPVKKKTPKKKTSAKVKAEDDSDLDGSGSEIKERKVNRNSGFHVRQYLPLPALVIGEY